jgi:hypothetical protein
VTLVVCRRICRHLAAIALAGSQFAARCQYSPPPLPNQGQAADTLGRNRMAVGVEAGWGTTGSWWNADNPADVDVHSGWVGAGRMRLGLGDDLDVGLAGGLGPQGTFVVGPEVKWRFAHLRDEATDGGPAFHAALTSGLGVGSAGYDYGTGVCSGGDCRRDPFVAPYTGILASGGIDVVQMFTGLRLAASETFGNDVTDLTLFPLLAFGVQLRPTPDLTLFAEADVGGGITTSDFDDSGLLIYPSAGISFAFDGPGQR